VCGDEATAITWPPSSISNALLDVVDAEEVHEPSEYYSIETGQVNTRSFTSILPLPVISNSPRRRISPDELPAMIIIFPGSMINCKSSL
jgi:hypothetical protein